MGVKGLTQPNPATQTPFLFPHVRCNYQEQAFVVLWFSSEKFPGGVVEMLERRQLLVITVIFLHLAWLPNISMGNQTSALETKSNAVQDIKPDLSWKNKVVEVLEEFLRERIKTPPATVSGTLVITNQWTRRKASHLSRQINATRTGAQNILGLVREINETASQLLWERSATSARKSRQLAEEAANLTRYIVGRSSKEKLTSWQAGMVTLQIKADMDETMKTISKFHESQNRSDAVLTKAEWESTKLHIINTWPVELDHVVPVWDSFRWQVKTEIDDMRKSLSPYINQTVRYLHLAQRYHGSSSSEIQYTLNEKALRAKDETTKIAMKACQKGLKEVEKVFETMKDTHENPDNLEQTLKTALDKTKLTYDKTKETWSKTNRKATSIARSILKYPEIQSSLRNATQAINQAQEDLRSAQGSNRVNLENFSESLTRLVKTASELSSTTRMLRDFNIAESMYGKWAEFYLARTRKRVRQVISDKNPLELRAREDFDASEKKWDKAYSNKVEVANISLGVVEEATRDMNHQVDQVQVLFKDSSVKAKALIDKYKKQYLFAFREVRIASAKSILISVRDHIIEEAEENYRTINLLTVVDYRRRIFFKVFVVVCVSITISAILCKKLLEGFHIRSLPPPPPPPPSSPSQICHPPSSSSISDLANLTTEENMLKLNMRQMRRVLWRSRDEVGEELAEEELQVLLKNLGLQRRRNSSLVPRKHFEEEDDDWSKCKVCMAEDVDSVILDCGHLVACNHCGKKLTKCPICRQQVVKLHKKEFKKMLDLCGVQFKTGVTARRMLLLQGGQIPEKDPKCKVCLDNNIDSVFLPCGHMMTCIQCGSKLVNCPICPNMPRLAMVNKIYRA